ncbi:hypothetical protein C8J56DRAFT_957528 [Mycena floridula]|nr:hypothetical protein C8J56DRAFT_962136 [Mycena floridula]KAJ7582328.1 hypothetical protein C8J56DRAFT_957528 [Mycena floridula]
MRAANAFPVKLNYGLHLSILLLNLTVVGSMAWELWRTTQRPYYNGAIWAFIAIITTGVALLYTIALIILSLCRVDIPHLARILVDSIALAPAYIISIFFLAVGTNWGIIRDPHAYDDLCSDSSQYRYLDCNGLLNPLATIARLQLVGIIFGFVALVLTLVDCGFSIKLHQRKRRERRAQAVTA